LPERGPERPKSTSPVLKIVVAVLGFLALATVLALGSCLLAYRARQKAKELEQAITIPSVAPGPVQQQPTPEPQPPSQTVQEITKVTAKDGQCALFSKPELTQLLGTNFVDAAEDATGCTYKGGAPREWVRVEIHWTGGRKEEALYRNAYENLKKSMPAANIPVQPFPGVGDEAYVNLWNVVHVRKGDSEVDFDLRFYHDSTDQTKAVIEKALSKL
jgi:hypothetical protein